MTGTMISARGVNGTVSFDGRMITISHMNVRRRLFTGGGEKRVPLSSLAAVEWKSTWPGWFGDLGGRGFIRFTLPGGIEHTARIGNRTGRALRDENSVLFSQAQQPDFERVRDAIEKALPGGSSDGAD